MSPGGEPSDGADPAGPARSTDDVLQSAAFQGLLKASPVIELQPGDMLLHQGAPSDAAYFLAAGDVTVVADTPYGPVRLATLSAPRLVGEVGALADLPRTASVVAASPIAAYRIERRQLRDLGQRTPALLLSVIGQLGRQLDGVNKTIGLYTNAVSALERREFDPRLIDDLQNPPAQLAEFAAVFGRFAGQIQSKRRQQDELASAAILQQSFLPKTEVLDGVAGSLDVRAVMRPAREVGGDFYDYFLIDRDRLAFAIGDICGKGLPAALFTAIVVTVLRTAAREEQSPAATVARANAILCRDNAACLFATVVFGIVEVRTGRVSYCNCGHNAPVVVRADGSLRSLPATGLPLGLYDDRSAAEAEVLLDPGEALVLYTDGLSEAVDEAGVEFGELRLHGVLERSRGAGASALVAGLLDAVDAFAGTAEPSDDRTCVVVRRRDGHRNQPT